MDARLCSIFAVLFYISLLVGEGSADLNTLFGTTSEDDDIVLYVMIGFILLSVILIIFMIVCLYWLNKVVKRKIKKRQEQLALEERRKWRGGVDDIIDDAHRMVPLPRAASTSEKGLTNGSFVNGSINFVSSRI